MSASAQDSAQERSRGFGFGSFRAVFTTAANPLKRDTYKEKNSTTLTNLFYILGLIAIMVLIIKQFKTNSTPGNNAIPVARAVPVRI